VLADRESFSVRERQGLREWFWVTTYGEVFRGVGAKYVRARDSLADMLANPEHNYDETPMNRDVTPNISEPTKFDYRAARSTAFALLLARTFDGGATDGEAHRALGRSGTKALFPLRSGDERSEGSTLVIAPSNKDLQSLREAFKAGTLGDELRKKHGFPPNENDMKRALELRFRSLCEEEKRFVESFRLSWRSSES
jgi:hypothetical protein